MFVPVFLCHLYAQCYSFVFCFGYRDNHNPNLGLIVRLKFLRVIH